MNAFKDYETLNYRINKKERLTLLKHDFLPQKELKSDFEKSNNVPVTLCHSPFPYGVTYYLNGLLARMLL
jgi:hypothetical protein